MKLSSPVLALLGTASFLFPGLVSAQVLTHGPVVGGVTKTKANVFVRSDQAATVVVRYGTDPTLTRSRLSNSIQTNAESDFTAIVPLAGLAAEKTYYLNVLVNGVPQLAEPYPYFTTFAPPGKAREFKFVVLTDFHGFDYSREPVQTFASAEAVQPAFCFIGGDFDHSGPLTLTEKRDMFKALYDPNTPFSNDFVPMILRRMAIAHQWDDHDAGPNNLDKNYPDWNLTQQVFEEYVPTYPLPSVTPGIWQQFSYAQADFFILDCRSQRDVWDDPEGPDKSMLDGNNLGADGQLEWLQNGLLTSRAKWKIIFTSVVTNTSTKGNDAWAPYQTEWNALKNFILANNILNVVFISGDLHLAAIDNGVQAGFPEMCVAGANQIKNRSCATGRNGTWSEGFYDDTCAGFGLVSILQNPDRLVLEAADEFGIIHLAYTVPDEDGQSADKNLTTTALAPSAPRRLEALVEQNRLKQIQSTPRFRLHAPPPAN